jgi:hypothetical protein
MKRHLLSSLVSPRPWTSAAHLLGMAATTALGLGLGTTAASAAGLTGATVTGDYYLYCANATSTYRGPTCTQSVGQIVGGSASSPTGNVELGARTEVAAVGFTSQAQLSGTIGGQSITLSSLTLADWMGDADGNGKNLAQEWISALVTHYAANLGSTYTSATGQNNLYNMLRASSNTGLRRFSDPNIAYVSQEGATVKVGLAGHLDARTLFAGTPLASLPVPLQVSELVKVTYGGNTFFKYGFLATNSGLVNNAGVGADGISHKGNYEVSFTAVPEPSLMLGTLGALALAKGLKGQRRKTHGEG